MNTSFITPFLLYFLVLLLIPSSSSSSSLSSSSTVFSCGDLSIKCPFTLEGRPRNCPNGCSSRFGSLMKPLSCGYSPAERILSCENNRTVLNYSSKKFYVLDIDYEYQRIRVIDPGLQKDNCSSMPQHSIPDNFYFQNYSDLYQEKAVVYMNCLTNMSDFIRYINAKPCVKSSLNMFTYVIVNPLVSDFKESCNNFLTSWMSGNRDTFSSYLDVHNELMNGWVLLGRSVLGTLCVLSILVYILRIKNRAMNGGIEDFLNTYEDHMPMRYSYNDVKRMTRNFKEKLGQGGYGSVYKGFLRNNRAVAIKILSSSKGNGQDFVNEVATIGRIHHVNVVQLIGFVAESSKRALVYELMQNGSLEKYIFPRDGKLINLLSWEKTYEIALGVARGIEYLHRGCDMRILHFDIKPHNILLDENYNPKVSDFGLARLYSMDDSIISLTMARGTIGYMAPELFYRSLGGVSHKSDVYSFGMLLMEMAGRRKNLNTLVENSSQLYFPTWIYSQLNQGEDIKMEDATEEENEIAKKLIIVALWCIQLKPIDRPSMTKVVEMLEGDLELLQIPYKPLSMTDLHEEHEYDTCSTGMTYSSTSIT
ncbi:hypothetical protein MKW94_019859 [Papaver nudicaule]|uniref:Protein kinase domain-containing protein n=1 Tax=Papaver nudicaule TaxID=74823 RepID=A0AA41VX66_PAPNU|nr:hypothetical protein [Papaver nudicaule]